MLQADGEELEPFTRKCAQRIGETLAEHGAVLIRGARAASSADFERALKQLGFEPLPYTERSTPRSQVGDGVYTSTEYPAREEIPQHCESSYAGAWPGRLAFFCAIPALTGGATPITDVTKVLADIPADVISTVERHGLQYIRNYGSGVGLDWREAFQTDSRTEVDRFCADSGMERQWLPDDRLRTIRRAPALAEHPRTGRRLWFNHLILFHQSSLHPELREDLLAVLGEDGLPNDVLLGNGEPIPDGLVAEVRSAFDRHRQRFAWERHDLMVIDNMRFSHGREPFTGERRVLVSMTELINRS